MRISCLVRILIFLAATLLSIGCGEENTADDIRKPSGAVPIDFSAGPNGTEASFDGVTIVIPPGALSADLRINGFFYPRSSLLAVSHGIGPFLCGIELGPAGTRFSKPITITLATETAVSNTGKYPVFLHGTNPVRWTQESAPGIASAGNRITFQVDHFSTFAVGGWCGDCLAAFPLALEGSGDASAAFALLKESILQGGRLFETRKRVGRETFRICGVAFDVMSKLDGDEHQFVELVGEESGTTTQLYYAEDRMTSSDKVLIANILITLYWRPVPLARYAVDYVFSVSSSADTHVRLDSYTMKISTILEIDEHEPAPAVYGFDPNYPGTLEGNASVSGGTLEAIQPGEWLENISIPRSPSFEMFGTVMPLSNTSHYIITPGFLFQTSPFSFDLCAMDDGTKVSLTIDEFDMFVPQPGHQTESPAGSHYGAGFRVELYDGYATSVPACIGSIFIFNGTCSLSVTKLPDPEG